MGFAYNILIVSTPNSYMPSREQRIKEILLELDAEMNEVPSILNSTDCPYTLVTFINEMVTLLLILLFITAYFI